MKGPLEHLEVKRHVAALYFLGSAFISGAQTLPDYALPSLPPTVESLGYRGAVKSVSEFQYEIAVSDSGEERGNLVQGANHFAASFHKKGFMISQIIYHNDSLTDTYSYTWNALDKLVRITLSQDDTVREVISIRRNQVQLPTQITYADQSGVIYRKIEQKFGPQQELLQQIEYNQDITAARASFEYNDEMKMVAMRQKNQDDELVVEYKYSYTPDGDPLQMSVFDSFGLLANRTEYLYDSLGRHVEEIVYNTYGKTIQRTKKTYEGTSKKIIDYVVQGAQPERLIHREISSYNEQGDCIATKSTSLHSNQRESWNFQYTYDDRGNWIEKTHLKQGVPFYKTVRTLTYFE